MKVVLDADVVIAGLRSPTGASAELMRMARTRKLGIVVSVPLLLEYESVVIRPEQLQAMRLSAQDALAVIDVLVDVAEWTKISFLWRPQTRDPGDEMVLEAAINARVDAIVTFNRRDFGDAPARFGIGCWLPREALEKMR